MSRNHSKHDEKPDCLQVYPILLAKGFLLSHTQGKRDEEWVVKTCMS